MTIKNLQSAPLALIVDDEPDLVTLVSYNLESAGFRVITASNGHDAVRVATSQKPNIIILDVMMPETPGTEVARRLRADPRTAGIPIIMLTARAAETDQLAGLALGADDYMTKPFSMRVLLARVDALLRRVGPTDTPSLLTLGPIAVDLDTHEARVDGATMTLTPTEFRLLAALLQARGKALDRDELISRGMGPGVAVTDRAIDVHIAAVRKKLGRHADIVQTVRGVGYRASLADSAATSPAL